MPPDELLRRFLRISAAGYAATAMRALVDQRGFEESLAFFDRDPEFDSDFWRALGVGYLATIAGAAWVAGRDRMAARRLLPPLLVAKTVTTAIFGYRFAKSRRPSYAISALTDGALLGAMLWLSRRSPERHLRLAEESAGEVGG